MKLSTSPLFLAIFLWCGMSYAVELTPVGFASQIAAGSSVTAMATIESYNDEDLNGDGDTRDRILTFHDVATGEVTNTGIVVDGRLATDGVTVVFLYSERVDQIDFNGDGDRLDRVLAYYHIPSAELVVTSIEPYLSAGQAGSLPHYSVHENIITFVSREFWRHEDFNGDGDHNDYVVRYWDTDARVAYNTPLVSPYAMVDHGVIATRVAEASGVDANGDGDNDDIVFVTYDIGSTQLTPVLATSSFNLSNIASFPFKDGDNYYFRAREDQVGFDVDGNGQVSSTNVLIRLNLVDGNFAWTGIAGTTGEIRARGAYITYETAEGSVGIDVNGDGNLQYDYLYALHNLATGEIDYFLRSGTIALGSGVFALATYEGANGDLSGDGDKTDHIVSVASLVEEDVPDISNCAADDTHCRLLRLIDYLEHRDALTDGASALLVALVQETDRVLLADAPNDLARYIQVIDAFDVYFDTIWLQNEIPDHLKYELVEDHRDGRALKDLMHDIKDEAAALLEAAEAGGDGPDQGNADAQSLIAAMASAVQASSASSAVKDAMMAEVIGIIDKAVQIMGGADPALHIGTLFAHIERLHGIVSDPGAGLGSADIASIGGAVADFEAFLAQMASQG